MWGLVSLSLVSSSLNIILVGIFLFRTCLAFPSVSQSGSRRDDARENIPLYFPPRNTMWEEVPCLSTFPTNSLTWFIKWSMTPWLDTDVGHATESGISLVAFVPRVCRTKVGLSYLNPLSCDI